MKSGKTFDEYLQLVTWFLDTKYKDSIYVTTNDPTPYENMGIKVSHDICESSIQDQFSITTHDLILTFCNAHDENHRESNAIYINGRVVFENKRFFDKLRNCYPPIVFIPKTKEDFDLLLKFADHVGSVEYLNWAREFEEIEEDDEIDEFYDNLFNSISHLIDDSL